MKKHIGIRILPNEFEAFKRLARGDSQFDCTHDEWERRHAKGERIVTISPQELSIYSLQIGQPPSFAVLGALAIKKARDEDEGRT